MGGGEAGVGDEGEVVEEELAMGFGQNGEDFSLQGNGDFAPFGVLLFARGFEVKAVGAAIFFVRFASEEAGGFHAFNEGSDRVWVTAHE